MLYNVAMISKFFEHSGAALILLSGVLLLFGGAIGINPLWGFALYAAGIIIMVLNDVGSVAGRLSVGSLLALFGLYTLLAFWDFIFIVLLLPAIFLDMILGAFALLAGLLSVLLLAIYVIEEILHHDIAGVSGLETGRQAIMTLGVAVVSLGVGLWHLRQDDTDNTLADRIARLSERVRSYLFAIADTIRAG